MSLPPVPLTPDDDPQAPVHLSGNRQEIAQPYGYAAVMAGMFLLLLLRGFRVAYGSSLLNIVLAGTVITYALLVIFRPRLPLYLLTVAAAELGLLYSLPGYLLFSPRLLTLHNLAVLVMGITLTATVGLLSAVLLKVEEHPEYIIPLNFLLLFVLVGGFLILRG